MKKIIISTMMFSTMTIPTANAQHHQVTAEELKSTHFCATVTKLWRDAPGVPATIAYIRDSDSASGAILVSDDTYRAVQTGSKITVGQIKRNTAIASGIFWHSLPFSIPSAVPGCDGQ